MKDLSNENIVHIKGKNVEYIQFKKLLEYKDILSHAYGIGNSINYRMGSKNRKLTEEEINNAKKAYKNLCEEINCNSDNLVRAIQDHTDIVEIVDSEFHIKNEMHKMDGICANKADYVLATTNADCILMILFDPEKRVVTNVHSGWRGTLQRISIKAVENMQKEFGCDPKNIICCMAPSIRKCHFEVEKDVKDLFEKEFGDLKEINSIIEKKENSEDDKWFIDTILINHIILNEAGLKKENIIDSGICSVCNCDMLHSYRVEKEKYGLNSLIVSLK